MDEVLALPSEFAVNIALRTQQVLAEETGVINTIDPLAGSYFIEALTNEIEEKAREYIEKIDEMGVCWQLLTKDSLRPRLTMLPIISSSKHR